MKKKTLMKIESILLLALVFATILPVAEATNIMIVNNDNQTFDKDIYIDPNIFLTKAKLPLLKRSIKDIDNPNVKQFVQEVITTVNNKEYVNSNDIAEIAYNSNLRNIGIYTGWLESRGEGTAYIPRMIIRFFREILTGYPLQGTIVGPAIISKWRAENSDDLIQPKTSINGIERYSTGNKGIIIGFCGKITNNVEQGIPLVRTSYELRGFCGLIIILSNE